MTLRDVARLAKTSVTTVSHALNSTRFVSPEVKARIFEVAGQLGYTGNSIARSLRLGRTATVGLVVSDIDNPFFTQLASRVQVASAERGYQVIFANTEKNAERERDVLMALNAQQLDGIILAAPVAVENVDWLRARGAPIAVVNGDFEGRDVPQVITDDLVSGHLGIDHLWQLGHRRIAVVHGDADHFTTRNRMIGVRAALAERGVDLEPARIAEAAFPSETGEDNVLKLIGHSCRPTALFAISPWALVVTLRALARGAVRFPEDMSLVGVGVDSPYWVPATSVTMVQLPVEDMARAAVELLIGRVGHDGAKGGPMVFLPTLVCGRSSAAPPALS